MNKKTRNILIAIIAALVIGGVAFMFLISPPSGKTVVVEPSNREMPTADGITDELTKGLVVEEDFINTTENINEVAVVFSRLYYLDENDSDVPVAIELLYGGKVLAKTEIISNDIPDQHRVYLNIESPINGYVGKELTLKIYETAGSDTGVSLMRAENSESYYFGNKKINGTICFSITGQ